MKGAGTVGELLLTGGFLGSRLPSLGVQTSAG